ncbi:MULTISPECIES: M3 family metallopeptidase [Sphingomonas]|jgi:peptidyl-dipeptidase Dcp|uniref:Dipeptidyl carboxypeptidase n=2 Tax=Sphingomonas hankookensis TaxID=563996 RepID=A0ABR5YAK0_9SPHN|nr:MULTISPECIES: M3 family metallopeptidase [Sphingomonas]KZE11856.1 dipeptidyl carboxypeptidase [Sphingomonas hankookensis]PZT93244.1 MAG: M3 family peptidase [Sphingomonas sp.]RSV29014.1 M3 family peptidase [Sphingomonas sp. ABOLH]WCP70902.1 M3 family metallopeptidase [Sphingomonas hankookensis]
MRHFASAALLLLMSSTVLAQGTAPSATPATALPASSPFAKASTLPFEAPPFDRIKSTDYKPALLAGMAAQRAEINAITRARSAPTFENTIAAMERSGRLLERASLAFYGVVGANTDDTLQQTQADLAPVFAAHQDAINLDPALFARVKTLYDQRRTLGLDAEQLQVLTLTYQGMVRAGAQLSPADKATLSRYNGQLSTLETAFQQKLLAAAKAGALVVDDKAKLAGLSEGEIAAAAAAAKDRGLAGKYVLTLQNTTQQPELATLKDRATREALFKASWTRAAKGDANDTRATIADIALLRAQKAKLIGFATWADYVLQDQMAKTPKTALGFMQQLGTPVAAEQRREAAELQAQIKATGGNFELKPWDWDFYSEQVRKAKYDLNQDELKPYFEINKVLTDGVFYAANQLYGVTFKRRTDLPVYHPDVMVYEVNEANGASVGLMYFDFWKRDNKNGGAWMSNFVNQSKLLGTKPVIYNVSNFTKPAAGQPGLISFDDVTTMFHEFGHALHGLFANQTYPSISGTNTARDFVEFPSQFNEHWALDPKVLPNYAVNYRTGQVIPQALVDKIKRAATFNSGYSFGEALAAAEMDMSWHSLSAVQGKQNPDAFEAQALAATGLDIANVPPRYRSTYFLHIWGNGYSAGYYAYSWTKMLSANAFNWFEEHGGMTRANGQRFRDMILSKGHTEDYATMFRNFNGADPQVGPLLKDLGLNADGSRIKTTG